MLGIALNADAHPWTTKDFSTTGKRSMTTTSVVGILQINNDTTPLPLGFKIKPFLSVLPRGKPVTLQSTSVPTKLDGPSMNFQLMRASFRDCTSAARSLGTFEPNCNRSSQESLFLTVPCIFFLHPAPFPSFRDISSPSSTSSTSLPVPSAIWSCIGQKKCELSGSPIEAVVKSRFPIWHALQFLIQLYKRKFAIRSLHETSLNSLLSRHHPS